MVTAMKNGRWSRIKAGVKSSARWVRSQVRKNLNATVVGLIATIVLGFASSFPNAAVLSLAFILIAILLVILLWPERTAETFLIREGTEEDAPVLHELLERSYPKARDQDITPEAIFRSWLREPSVRYRIIEKVRRGRSAGAVAFYSIHILSPESFAQIRDNRLLHDEIGAQHLVVPGADADGALPPVALFVLDVETDPAYQANPRVPSGLFVDILEEIRRLHSSTQIVHLAALGASDKGQYWAPQFYLEPDPAPYFPAEVGDEKRPWFVYSAGPDVLRSLLQKMETEEWPDLSLKRYPYILDHDISKAVRVLSRLLKRRTRE